MPKLCEIGIARSASDEGHHSCNIIQKPETSPIKEKSGPFKKGKQYHRQLKLSNMGLAWCPHTLELLAVTCDKTVPMLAAIVVEED